MKAIKYSLKVCEGMMDFIHEGGYMIIEIYIPDLELFINEQNVFSSENSEEAAERMKTGVNKIEIEVNDSIRESAEKWLSVKTELKEAEAELFDVFWENA